LYGRQDACPTGELLDAGAVEGFETLEEDAAGGKQRGLAVVHEPGCELCWFKRSI
jgi:hypothetical protein